MTLGKVFDRFARFSPVTVMMRAVCENVLPPARLDELFREHAREQYEDELLFSTAVEILSLAVCGIRSSVHSAFQATREDVAVSVTSVYNKLLGTEPQVSQALVRDSANRLTPVIEKLKAQCPPLLKGYNSRILDGNHLAATEHRLQETWTIGGAPLPGFCLVVLDPEFRLMRDVFPCEDGHAQERSLLGNVLATVRERDLWIADRNFCTTDFLLGIAARLGSFVIREHANGLRNKQLLGRRRAAGQSETGSISEQNVRIGTGKNSLTLRRITIHLNEPTRDGDQEMHILTNIPEREADAATIARIYRQRWQVETAFQELGHALHGEINTLCYPRAALLAFCIALYTYNILSVIKAALRAVHGDAAALDQISGYYLAAEIAATYWGMLIAIDRHEWTKAFASLTPEQLARLLRELAGNVRLSQFQKRKRGPKRPPPARSSGAKQPHVSTKRILDERVLARS